MEALSECFRGLCVTVPTFKIERTGSHMTCGNPVGSFVESIFHRVQYFGTILLRIVGLLLEREHSSHEGELPRERFLIKSWQVTR